MNQKAHFHLESQRYPVGTWHLDVQFLALRKNSMVLPPPQGLSAASWLVPLRMVGNQEIVEERVVDNMDTKDLVNYVMDDLDRYYEKRSDMDFLEDAYNYWEDHFDDVVEEIEDYMKCKFKKER